MKNLAAALALSAFLASGCSSSPKTPAPAPAAGQAETKMTAEEYQKFIDTARALAGLPPEHAEDAVTEERQEWIVVDDPVTGRKLQRIPKNETLSVVDGKLRHSLLNPKMFSLPLVREDESFYYVEPPEVRPRKAVGERLDAPPEGLQQIRDVPASEYAVVTPPVSGVKVRFEEKSEGLPRGGYWRSNMALADLDGDGALEIVTPAPRLAATAFRIFEYENGVWKDVPFELDVEPGVGQAYGGVAVADMDGDGRPDVVTVGHGAGPAIAFNRGAFKFRIESRGLPREMSSRAIAAGDIDRDGRLDLLAISDEPEAANYRQQMAREAQMRVALGGKAEAKKEEEPAGGYRKGFDVRAFFGQADGTFVESTAGLESACYAYALGLYAPPAGEGDPFFVSGCRYTSGRGILFEWDGAAKAFRPHGRDVAETSSVHGGVAIGTHLGKPAGFVSYIKGNVPGAIEKPTRGYGLSLVYKDGSAWTSKRLVKVLTDNVDENMGIGAGDLNGDGLDDVAWGDDVSGRVRVLFQTKDGGFEELAPELQPKYPNHSMSIRIADVDRDGRNDIVLMFEFRSSDRSRAGGLKYFRNLG